MRGAGSWDVPGTNLHAWLKVSGCGVAHIGWRMQKALS